MALDGTADGLRATIAEWLDDATLATAIPDCIRMCEARLNRILKIYEQEVRATAVLTGEFMSLPVDCKSVRSINFSGSLPYGQLTQIEAGDMLRTYGGVYSSATPQAFSVSGNELRFAPAATAPFPIEIIYFRRLPPLAINSSNWLIVESPDVYLYGSLMAAEMRGWNDARLPMLKAAFDSTIPELIIASEQMRWGASPIAPRINAV